MQLSYDDINFPTIDEKSQIDLIWTSPLARRHHLIREAMDSREKTLQGVQDAPTYWTSCLRAIDPLLRLRWDRVHFCWTVDRLAYEIRAFMPIVHWRTVDAGPLPLGPNLLDMIIQNDLQKTTPQEHKLAKYRQAESRRAHNAKLSDNKVNAAIDSLSTDRMIKFMEVENAITSGETLIAHGDDLAFIDRQREQLRQLLRRDELRVHAGRPTSFQNIPGTAGATLLPLPEPKKEEIIIQ